ncbi:hypothetical protein P8C59_007975 [Phyllachora maydis]|uniref:Uncharacterized protein n=1 Tax=Phyllachora maydis TaxID=1825666 RepID=A0AAD9IAK2_9PEZI|nr:hypothetical protein P8C59_007975 [Phyllachora maydis]
MTLILLDRHLICSLNFSLDNTPEPFDFALAPSSPSQNRAFANLPPTEFQRAHFDIRCAPHPRPDPEFKVSTLKVPSVPREERQRQFAAPSPPDSALSCALSSDLTNPAPIQLFRITSVFQLPKGTGTSRAISFPRA